jgi:hypothetical protein
VALIRELGDVESAYLMRPVPPPVNPAYDPRNVNQGYEDAAPNGIDARYAWGFVGGDGAGVGFVDMERGRNLNHEDLAAAGITLISGISNDFFFDGTSVLGEVLMVDNYYNAVDAIVDAVAHMAFGDVLLLEAQETRPTSATPGRLWSGPDRPWPPTLGLASPITAAALTATHGAKASTPPRPIPRAPTTHCTRPASTALPAPFWSPGLAMIAKLG